MPTELHIGKLSSLTQRGESVFERAELMGVNIPTSCLKDGKCHECLVEVTAGMELLSPKSLEELTLTGNFRLACRARIDSTSGHVYCHTLKREQMRIEDAAQHLPASLLGNPLSPAVRIEEGTVLIDGRRIGAGDAIYGIALDIGTTTVAARLLNLQNGHLVAAAAFENPQRFAGSNVMSRIHYDMLHKGRLQQRTLCGYLCHIIECFPVNPLDIYEIVVAANPAMRDLFFGLNTQTIGQQPFRSITELEQAEGKRTTTSLTTTPKKLQLPVNPSARIFGLPVIRSHVGADAAACLLAIDILNHQHPVLLMDIGTNIELVCGVGAKLYVASCPAGPAFEGGSVSCGMPAMKGAIEKFTIAAEGDLKYTTIHGADPEGICGSGLIDILSELTRTGKISRTGRLLDGSERFEIAPAQNIYLSESDISELAQAKGASSAGIKILLETAGLKLSDLNKVYLAGGFARHLDVGSARNIGLIPDLPAEKFVQVGNAALEGTCIALLSVNHRTQLESIVASATHIPLEQHPAFFDYFVDGCLFGQG
jgi:uncharacterized 2Fe-2S/4Fe-4S cluster protein (DUF4445 family)